MTTTPAGIDPDLYAAALADVRALRPYGTYRHETEPVRKDPTPGPDCGLQRGYARHRRAGENACGPCLAANAARTLTRKD